MKKILILAKNGERAREVARKFGIAPKDYRYAHSPKQFFGTTEDNTIIIAASCAWANKNAVDIRLAMQYRNLPYVDEKDFTFAMLR